MMVHLPPVKELAPSHQQEDQDPNQDQDQQDQDQDQGDGDGAEAVGAGAGRWALGPRGGFRAGGIGFDGPGGRGFGAHMRAGRGYPTRCFECGRGWRVQYVDGRQYETEVMGGGIEGPWAMAGSDGPGRGTIRAVRDYPAWGYEGPIGPGRRGRRARGSGEEEDLEEDMERGEGRGEGRGERPAQDP